LIVWHVPGQIGRMQRFVESFSRNHRI